MSRGLSARSGSGGGGPIAPVGLWARLYKEIERLGLPYHDESQFEMERLDIARRRVQVRDAEHVAPKDKVAEYVVSMPHNIFPPIIVTEDDYLIDGNTREEALKKLNVKFFPAIVIEIPFVTATPHQKRLLQILGATLNANAGLSLTPAERRKHVRTMLIENWTAESIARALAVKSGVVGQVKHEIDAEAKLEHVGINFDSNTFSLTGLRALGSDAVTALNNEPYKQLALLAKDAGLGFNEIRVIAKEMRDSGADEAALAIVANKRREFHDRIVQYHLTGNGGPPAPSILRQRLGYVNGFEGREHELVERNPDNSEKHFESLKTAIKVLKKVLELQS